MLEHGAVDWGIVAIFVTVYVGMFLGGLPRLKLDRSGVALLGAIGVIGLAAQAVAWLGGQGVHLGDAGPLFVAGVGLSNLVSNVPAVMLLPHLKGPESGVTLALVSTLAGNLLLVASIANLIVVDLACRSGIAIDVRAHARIGIPVTLATLGVVCVCLRWGL